MIINGIGQLIVMVNTYHFISFILSVRRVDAPAGVTQEEGHTRFLRLPSAMLALTFIGKKIQSSLSLVDREVEFCIFIYITCIFIYLCLWYEFLFHFCFIFFRGRGRVGGGWKSGVRIGNVRGRG